MYDNLLLLKDIVDNTPLPTAVYTGEELKIELANPAMIKTWGKGDQIIEKNYHEVLPETQNQPFFDQALQDQVQKLEDLTKRLDNLTRNSKCNILCSYFRFI